MYRAMQSDDSIKLSHLLLLLAGPIYNALEKSLLSLHPELHLFDWTACLLGSIAGQCAFKADTWFRMLAGLMIGYCAGLYGGPQWAAYWGWEEANAARAFVAFASDVVIRVVDFILRNPRTAADFVVEYGGKVSAFLTDDMVGKIVDKVGGLFKRK